MPALPKRCKASTCPHRWNLSAGPLWNGVEPGGWQDILACKYFRLVGPVCPDHMSIAWWKCKGICSCPLENDSAGHDFGSRQWNNPPNHVPIRQLSFVVLSSFESHKCQWCLSLDLSKASLCPWSWLWKSTGCSPDSHSNCCAHSNSPCANVWSAVHQHRSGTSGPAKSGVWGVAVANMVIKSWNHVESPVSWVSRSDNETPTYGIYDKKQWTNNGKWGQHAKPSCPTWLPNFVKTDMEKTKAKWYSMLESCKSWTTIHRHWIEKYQNKTNHCHCNRFLDELPSFTGNYSRS